MIQTEYFANVLDGGRGAPCSIMTIFVLLTTFGGIALAIDGIS
jgi:hypothetical protein